MPLQRGETADNWGHSFKFVPGKIYHVKCRTIGLPPEFILLDTYFSENEWSVFRQDVLDAMSGTYVWRDPLVLKQREWFAASKEAERLYQQMQDGLVSREVWKASEDRATALYQEYLAIQGTNSTAIYCQ